MWKKFLKNLKLSESYISMALGLLVVVVIGILLFNFFTGRGKVNVGNLGGEKTQQGQQTEGTASLPTTYTVAEGDTLWSISEKYYKSGYNWVDIAKENNLANADFLEAGQKLTIPNVKPIAPETAAAPEALKKDPSITNSSYTVVEGDNLWNIAVAAYGDGYKWPEIAKANKLENPDLIFTGNVLTLPR